MTSKRFFTVCLNVSIGICIACIVFEFILRVTDTNSYSVLPIDPASGLYIHTPDTSYQVLSSCFQNTVYDNNLGFHGPPVSEVKPKGVFRIVVLGSSFIEADQVPVADMFPVLLQQELNANPNRPTKYEVIPLGFSGNGTYLDTLYYKRFGESLKPDLVIDFETEYEFQSGGGNPQFDSNGNVILNLPIVEPGQDSPLTSVRDAYHSSKLAMNIFTRYGIVAQDEKTTLMDFLAHPSLFVTTQSSEPGSVAETASSSDAALWQKEDALTNGLVDTVRNSGAQFMLFSWATSNAGTSTAQELTAQLQAISSRDHFDYFNLDPFISAAESKYNMNASWSCDAHWSENGHLWAAEGLYQYLLQHPGLITPR